MALYHRDIGFPQGLEWWSSKRYRLLYSAHAKREAVMDRYNPIRLPLTYALDQADVFEVEASSYGEVYKIAARVPYNHLYDLTLVMVQSDHPGALFVKTVWLNDRADAHRTLKAERYARP